MKYQDIPGFEEFRETYKEKIERIKHIQKDSAYVIFLDGKNATKGHKKDMLSQNGFTCHIMQSAEDVLKSPRISFTAFSIMDELTLYFPSGKELIDFFNDDDEDSILSLFTVMFCREFEKYDSCLFRGCIYKTDQPVEKIIGLRKLCGQVTGLEYYVKEFLPKKDYIGKNTEELTKLLQSVNLYEDYYKRIHLREGYFVQNRREQEFSSIENSIADIMNCFF